MKKLIVLALLLNSQPSSAWNLFSSCIDQFQKVSESYYECDQKRELKDECSNLRTQKQKKELECEKEGYTSQQLSAANRLAYEEIVTDDTRSVYRNTLDYLTSHDFIESSLLDNSDFFPYSYSYCSEAYSDYVQYQGDLVNNLGMVFFELQEPVCLDDYENLILSAKTITKLRSLYPDKKFVVLSSRQEAKSALVQDRVTNKKYKVEIIDSENNINFTPLMLTTGSYNYELDPKGYLPKKLHFEVFDSDLVIDTKFEKHRILCNGLESFYINLNFPIENVSSDGECSVNLGPFSPSRISLNKFLYEIDSNYRDKRLISLNTRIKFRFEKKTRVLGSFYKKLYRDSFRAITEIDNYIRRELIINNDERLIVSIDILSADFE